MLNIPKLNLSVLLVCHNRKALTLHAVHSLFLANEKKLVDLSLYVFDDGSKDGTGEALGGAYPKAHIVSGDGNAFWNGGLHAIWNEALPYKADAFVWLNDDVALFADSLSLLVSAWHEAERRHGDRNFILCGATRGKAVEFSYAGKRRVPSPWAFRFQDVHPNGELQAIDTFNGNFVVVPRQVVDIIGTNDPLFFHNMGDIDYGLRAVRAGVAVWLMPEAVGCCTENVAKEATGFGGCDLSLFQQWQKINTHHGVPFLSWMRLTFRHSGVYFPLHFLIPYRRLVIPRWVFRLLARTKNRARRLGNPRQRVSNR